ncbi:unnamed protein product [Prorocentrum cordatum]|uniref:Phosphagen kinase N-terminal domain-containing protein n=1 Tax=Prorocentrum cordatum TaxID=2364126 RepID=A0ABN9QVN7_9DINO|nr:unnamed protein product [Polarella glacialis]
MPGLGSQPYPGFSSVSCPSSMPDLKEHHSAMACVLKSSPAIYEQLRDRTTSAGVGLAACIKPGVDDPGHPKAVSAGIVAGDEACYKEFSDLFYPVINRLHGAVVPASGHPFDADMSKLSLRSLDPQGGSVVSVRVELRRNVRGLRLAPCISHPERREVERLLVAGMAALGEEGPPASTCPWPAPRATRRAPAASPGLTSRGCATCCSPSPRVWRGSPPGSGATGRTRGAPTSQRRRACTSAATRRTT